MSRISSRISKAPSTAPCCRSASCTNLHAGRPIWVRYDLDRVRDAVTPADIATRPPTLWRYRELLPLPLDVEPVTLGEGMTPLLPCPRLGEQLGLDEPVGQGRIAAADGQLQEPRAWRWPSAWRSGWA